MSERKFTDDKVIKALECCINADCLNCPRWSEKWESGMCNDFLQTVLDLINRQKAEIDRLKKDNEYILMQHAFQRRPGGDCWNDVIEKAKAEAVERFAGRLVSKVSCIPQHHFTLAQVLWDIDNLVKEMTEDLR